MTIYDIKLAKVVNLKEDFPVPVYESDPGTELCNDLRRTVGAIACRISEPMSVTHVLMESRDKGMSALDLAAVSGCPPLVVNDILFALADIGWILRFEENGFEKFILDTDTIAKVEDFRSHV